MVGLVSALALGFGMSGISSGPAAPILAFGAMDEAVYGSAAVRMVQTGHVATSIYMDRLLLNKPPLLMWAGALSLWVLGISPFALRLPAVLAGAACCVLVYVWIRRSKQVAAALGGALLLLGTPLFHTVARRFTTDVLLTLFLVAALTLLAGDPRLERRGNAAWFGILSAGAIMSKTAAGLLPILVLFAYWLLAGKQNRPSAGRLAVACAVAAAAAAPWHIYQFIVHRQWFWSEYVRAQLVTVGLSGPAGDPETKLQYYLHGMPGTDPFLFLLSAA